MSKEAKTNFPTKYFNRAALPKLNAAERGATSILIVDPEQTIKLNFRQILTALGFGLVSDSADYISGLLKLEQRHFTHIIFDAKSNNMPSRDFLTKVFDYDPNIIAIPSSYDPSIDDVFDLLVLGADGYLVKPFNQQGVEDGIIMATKSEAISPAILHAKDRNEALASLIMTALDKMSVVVRQAQLFETARREVPRAGMVLHRAVEMGRTFAKGGEAGILDAMIEFCLERGNGPASKLGRTRKRIKNKNNAANESVIGDITLAQLDNNIDVKT